jgi:hypothetical protein
LFLGDEAIASAERYHTASPQLSFVEFVQQLADIRRDAARRPRAWPDRSPPLEMAKSTSRANETEGPNALQ